ncbi:hypothetical protein FD755_019627 [Muntiacus reevesi]|uniref:CobW C-terminal domain-containing protein n=2 Tax=Muntiacus TaxID=9885 RepID=A0A5N3X3A1_MUNRE|nr:hypothetical protein FD754_006516 [Muntiacus muntjak]KAB0368593.1 hypothetical protein FD755_019627 [Muntiacus reevesi]
MPWNIPPCFLLPGALSSYLANELDLLKFPSSWHNNLWNTGESQCAPKSFPPRGTKPGLLLLCDSIIFHSVTAFIPGECRGLVSIKDKPGQVIVQGVHELYDLEETPVNWEDDSERTNRLVLIGRNLDKDILKQLFIATVTETEKRWATHFQEDQVCP